MGPPCLYNREQEAARKWQATTGDALLAATTGASTANRSPTATTYLATAAIAG